MQFLTFQRFVVLSVILLCSGSSSLQAQVTYQGLLEGIYPTRLVIEESSPKATLSVSTLSNKINFIGGCNGDDCKYRGIDTALSIVFNKTDLHVEGRLRYGDGNSKAFVAEQIDSDALFPISCTSSFWLRTHEDKDGKHVLTLATLPGKQVRGTFYLTELGTSFSVSGTATPSQLDLLLEGPANSHRGTITAQLGGHASSSTVLAKLELEGTTTNIEFTLRDEMSLNCLQTEGQYDMVHPVFENTPYATLPNKLWKAVATERGDYSHVWFEPTLFNENVISGWMHSESITGRSSESINLDRTKNSKLKQNKILGSRRSQAQLVSVFKQRVIDQHPLHAEEDFQTWASTLELADFTLTMNGVKLASARHPVFGQLEAIIPWRELSKTNRLPTWLTQLN